MKAKILKEKIYFQRKNLFEVDLNLADIVYIYLPNNLMTPLETKIKKELKPGKMVITNTTRFPNLKPIDRVVTYPKISNPSDFETLFVYKM